MPDSPNPNASTDVAPDPTNPKRPERLASEGPAPVAGEYIQGLPAKPESAWMMVEGERLPVMSTPPPVRRDALPKLADIPPEPTGSIEDAMQARRASCPPAPRVSEPVRPAVDWAPVVAVVLLLAAFVTALLASRS